ncbi:hypothetical protein F511_32062 [Dorcoceras hygrometricum]|uniref:Uncharacterized protein n=1 Tax=Dorcoceras hygrometricum TaxID=472368 RepID=A0A2Z7B1U6_9LAMI|nr:hypothetical protein F511_32062 [Dorcoceras hygrometricum]
MSSIKNPLAAILDSNKFTGLNYQDWLRNLKIVLASEKLLYTLEKTPPKEAPADASPEELAKLEKCHASDPGPETGSLCQPTLEGLTRSAQTDSPQNIGRNNFWRTAAAAATSGGGGGGGVF